MKMEQRKIPSLTHGNQHKRSKRQVPLAFHLRTLINKGIYCLELNLIINVNFKSKTTCKSTGTLTKKLNNGVHI